MHNKTVDRFGQEKFYIQLTRIFLDEITSGRWQLEQQIPTEEDLCKKYNISKITVRQAINNLATEGYLTKIQGKGTFVTCTLPAEGLAVKTRLTGDMFGEEVKAKKEILFKGVKEPPEDVRNYLKTDEPVYCVLCKRLVNKEPAYLEESFIRHHLFPGIEKADIATDSLYSVLQESGVKKIFKVVQTVEAQLGKGDYAESLGIRDGAPLLVVHRLLLSYDSSPVAYIRFTGRSDKYKLQTEFEKIR
ncbi:MAG: GntR family transcriptional regulator [Nitrospirae bacterium]|nr:GntR family transcriptional regulator [Nitrospirota bacterium]